LEVILNKFLYSTVSLCAFSALFAFSSAPAAAHDAWFETTGTGYTVRYGHEKAEPYDPAKVKTLAAYNADGASLVVERQPGSDGLNFSVKGKPALLALHFDNGFWSKTAEGSKNIPKTEAPGATSSVLSLKYGKTVLAWSPFIAKPLGQRLEIVPLAETAPRVGGTLTVRVLWEGKPLPEVKIGKGEYELSATTDADGKASLPVGSGLQSVWVGRRTPLENDPRADTLSVSALLRFEAR
jgi:nickel transport protein